MTKANDIIQWVGAAGIILGHSLNAVGPAAYPWNILAFIVGTISFLIWAARTDNRPQLVVNLVAFVIGISGIYKAFFG